MADVSRRFSFATATTIKQLKNSSNNENIEKKHCVLVVGLEKAVFIEEDFQGNQNYEQIQLNTLLERFYAEIKNKHG